MIGTYQNYDCNKKKWTRPECWEENSVLVEIVLSGKALPVFTQESIEILGKIYTNHCTIHVFYKMIFPKRINNQCVYQAVH